MSATKKERQAEFLEAYVEYGTKLRACDATGISYCTVKTWAKKEARFAKAMKEATDLVCENLESHAHARAKAGSDGLLTFLLKALNPEKYRERIDTRNVHAVDNDIKELVSGLNPSLGPPKKRGKKDGKA